MILGQIRDLGEEGMERRRQVIAALLADKAY